SFNLYAYVRNNPVSAVDPDGRKDNRTTEEKAVFEDPDVLLAMGLIIELTGYERPFADRWEAGVVILKVGEDDYTCPCVATDGRLRSVRLTEPGEIENGVRVADGTSVFGTVHSHPGSGRVVEGGRRLGWTDPSKPSRADENNAKARGVPSYIIDSNKRLIKYDPKTDRTTKVLTGKDWKKYQERAKRLVKVRSSDDLSKQK
ncbi:hypothetical protein, partial [Thermogutta sp.]|uniref:hypothetical protein n=1 Tax=Thermogutta sp. TaxID=1962930 RepID=UPI00321FDFBE